MLILCTFSQDYASSLAAFSSKATPMLCLINDFCLFVTLQCAHGRPTMVPLVNLQILRQRTESQMTNDGFITTNTSRGNIPTASGACWHKLMKHPLSLERARERLH